MRRIDSLVRRRKKRPSRWCLLLPNVGPVPAGGRGAPSPSPRVLEARSSAPLVDELVFEQPAHQGSASVHLQLTARLGLQLADRGRSEKSAVGSSVDASRVVAGVRQKPFYGFVCSPKLRSHEPAGSALGFALLLVGCACVGSPPGLQANHLVLRLQRRAQRARQSFPTNRAFLRVAAGGAGVRLRPSACSLVIRRASCRPPLESQPLRHAKGRRAHRCPKGRESRTHTNFPLHNSLF
jgi:hypothetical protein